MNCNDIGTGSILDIMTTTTTTTTTSAGSSIANSGNDHLLLGAASGGGGGGEHQLLMKYMCNDTALQLMFGTNYTEIRDLLANSPYYPLLDDLQQVGGGGGGGGGQAIDQLSGGSVSGGGQQQQYSGRQHETVRNVITIIGYLAIVLVSLCGNLLVLKVAFGKPKMRTTTNMLIATLAISDLVTTVFNIPFNVARLLLLNWPFGSILCFLLPLIQCACVYVSTFTMAVIAVHRWHTVRKAHRPLATPQRRFSCLRLSAVVAVIGLLALGLSLPNAIFNETKQAVIYGTVVVRCRVTYPPDIGFNIRRFLTVEVFITQYLTPLFVTLVVYIEIGIFVWRQGRVLAISNDDRRRQQSEAKRRRILMLALVVIVFAVCWLPINVYHLLVDFKLIKHNFTVFLVVHWFAMSSVCYNPFIYCWLNESFRKGSKKFLKSLVRCRTQAPGGKPYITTTTTTIMTTKANAIANNINNTNARALVGLPTSAGAATAADSLLVSNCLGGAAAAAATLDDIGGNDGQQHRRNRQHIDTTTTTTTTTATITTTLGSPTTHCTISSV